MLQNRPTKYIKTEERSLENLELSKDHFITWSMHHQVIEIITRHIWSAQVYLDAVFKILHSPSLRHYSTLDRMTTFYHSSYKHYYAFYACKPSSKIVTPNILKLWRQIFKKPGAFALVSVWIKLHHAHMYWRLLSWADTNI